MVLAVNISCEYSAKKHFLRCRDILCIQKISDVRTIKNHLLRIKTSIICAYTNDKIKISDEYVIKICYPRTPFSHVHTKISNEYVIKKR